MTRRGFIRLAGWVAGAGLLGRLDLRGQAASAGWAAAEALDEPRRGRIVLSAAELAASDSRGISLEQGLLGTYGDQGILETDVVVAPLPFAALGAHWDLASQEGIVRVALRVSADGQGWSEWRELEEEGRPDHAPATERYGALLGLFDEPLPRYVQSRVMLRAVAGQSPRLRSLTLEFSDSTGGPTTEQAWAATRALAPEGATATCAPGPAIISRTAWGCRDGQASPRWVPQYQTVTHLFVHHTGTANAATDWATWVRAIWEYHATTLGWGDIGYSYLVDPNGFVYEGRAGGENVIAGHTYGFNSGSLGLAFLGTYETVAPPSGMVAAAERLLGWQADKRGIDVKGARGLLGYAGCKPTTYTLPTVLGHRDAPGHNSATPNACNGYGATSCPGDGLAAILPAIRNDLGSVVTVLSVGIGPNTVLAGGLIRVEITVRNDGRRPVWSQGPEPGFVYQEGQSYQSLGFAAQPGCFRVGVDLTARAQAQDHPYRWGLGCVLQPGATTTVTGFIRASVVGTRSFWAGLVQEALGWRSDNLGATSVVVKDAAYRVPLSPIKRLG